MEVALLMPIYQPSKGCREFLAGFYKGDFDHMLVIDDGSGEDYGQDFEEMSAMGFEVVRYLPNQGKGHAIKYGIDYLVNKYPSVGLIVTADGDGQHLYTDIMSVKESALSHPDSLSLGVRDFKGDNVPKHNRMGNRISSFYYSLYTHRKLGDTQTGLRAIPKALFPLALSTKGERYDFEMDFLLEASKELPINEVPIQTVYESGNASSHFNPFLDSVRIYRTPILYVLVALASAGIDILLFYLLETFAFASIDEVYSQLFSILCSRVVSGSLNFLLNMFLVFPSKGGNSRKTVRYFALFAVNTGLSFAFTNLFTYLGGVVSSGLVTFIKFLVDAAIAIMNFFINWLWVFARKRSKMIRHHGEKEHGQTI